MAATTADAGRLRATSAARFGPDSAAIRASGTPAASAMTSLMRSSVPRSSPLTTDNRSAAGRQERADRGGHVAQVRGRGGEDHEVRGRAKRRRIGASR